MKLSIVLPCYNEERNVEATIRDVLSWFERGGIQGEVIAVNDGSTDGTGEVLERLRGSISNLIVVTHERNQGYGSAVRSGCDAATQEYVGFMDGDGQFRAADFSLLVPFLAEFDFVTGRRVKRADTLIRTLNAKLYGFLLFVVLGVWVRDVNCAMKVWKRSIWPLIRPRYATGALINGEIFYRLKANRIHWKQVPVHHYPRVHGRQTGANTRVILRMFRDLFFLKRAYRMEQR